MRTEEYIVQINVKIKPYRFYNTFVHLVIIFMAIQIVIADLASYMHISILPFTGGFESGFACCFTNLSWQDLSL